MKHTQHKVTLESGSIFIKHKVERPNNKRKVFYMPVKVHGRDRAKLTLRQQQMIRGAELFPLRRQEFKEIVNRLKTTIKYKTRLE